MSAIRVVDGLRSLIHTPSRCLSSSSSTEVVVIEVARVASVAEPIIVVTLSALRVAEDLVCRGQLSERLVRRVDVVGILQGLIQIRILDSLRCNQGSIGRSSQFVSPATYHVWMHFLGLRDEGLLYVRLVRVWRDPENVIEGLATGQWRGRKTSNEGCLGHRGGLAAACEKSPDGEHSGGYRHRAVSKSVIATLSIIFTF